MHGWKYHVFCCLCCVCYGYGLAVDPRFVHCIESIHFIYFVIDLFCFCVTESEKGEQCLVDKALPAHSMYIMRFVDFVAFHHVSFVLFVSANSQIAPYFINQFRINSIDSQN